MAKNWRQITAAGLSLLFIGLGQVFLGQPGKGFGYFFFACLLYLLVAGGAGDRMAAIMFCGVWGMSIYAAWTTAGERGM